MILVRHGQSEWNAVFSRTRIDPNVPDAPLTPQGRRQAEGAAQLLARSGIERLLTSPYTRALETAAIISAQTGIAIAVEPIVRERAAFSCDIGTPRSQLAARWPHLSFDHIDEIWWQSAVESEAELGHRCGRFRTIARGMTDWQRVAVVTHWGFIRAITGVEAQNCQLVRFDPHAPE